MPFPIQVGELVVPHAVGLGYVIAADLAAGGGTILPDTPVRTWLPEAAAALDVEEQRSLVRSLLLRKHAEAIGVACEVALAVRPEGIGPYLLSAMLHHDLGTLMSPDSTGRTVEEVLARAGAELCPLDDPRWRGLVLAALRNAGAAGVEARVVARYGTASELREWGPPLLASGDPAVREAFEAARDRDIAPVLDALLGS